LRWIGRISYGLYLWQQSLFHGNAPSLLAAGKVFPIKMAVLLTITTASYYLIETPLIRYGRKKAASKRTAVVSGMPASEIPQ